MAPTRSLHLLLLKEKVLEGQDGASGRRTVPSECALQHSEMSGLFARSGYH